jgi:hypothetical protein
MTTNFERTLDGCLFRYAHSKNEPDETLNFAGIYADIVAGKEAKETGQNHVVARLIKPKGYAVFPAGHRALQSGKIIPVYEMTPEGEHIHLEQ